MVSARIGPRRRAVRETAVPTTIGTATVTVRCAAASVVVHEGEAGRVEGDLDFGPLVALVSWPHVPDAVQPRREIGREVAGVEVELASIQLYYDLSICSVTERHAAVEPFCWASSAPARRRSWRMF